MRIGDMSLRAMRGSNSYLHGHVYRSGVGLPRQRGHWHRPQTGSKCMYSAITAQGEEESNSHVVGDNGLFLWNSFLYGRRLSFCKEGA